MPSRTRAAVVDTALYLARRSHRPFYPRASATAPIRPRVTVRGDCNAWYARAAASVTNLVVLAKDDKFSGDFGSNWDIYFLRLRLPRRDSPVKSSPSVWLREARVARGHQRSAISGCQTCHTAGLARCKPGSASDYGVDRSLHAFGVTKGTVQLGLEHANPLGEVRHFLFVGIVAFLQWLPQRSDLLASLASGNGQSTAVMCCACQRARGGVTSLAGISAPPALSCY